MQSNRKKFPGHSDLGFGLVAHAKNGNEAGQDIAMLSEESFSLNNENYEILMKEIVGLMCFRRSIN